VRLLLIYAKARPRNDYLVPATLRFRWISLGMR
jgi:hypothetical protein